MFVTFSIRVRVSLHVATWWLTLLCVPPTQCRLIAILFNSLVCRWGSMQSLCHHLLTNAFVVTGVAVFAHRFMSIAEQMGFTLRRTAISVCVLLLSPFFFLARDWNDCFCSSGQHQRTAWLFLRIVRRRRQARINTYLLLSIHRLITIRYIYINRTLNVRYDDSLVANAPHLPVHLGAMQEAVKWQIGDKLHFMYIYLNRFI